MPPGVKYDFTPRFAGVKYDFTPWEVKLNILELNACNFPPSTRKKPSGRFLVSASKVALYSLGTKTTISTRVR